MITRNTIARGAALLLLLAAAPVHAHINMTGALKGRNGDEKMSPCDGPKGPVYTFEPGTTITLALDEAVPHPSYFRISFDNDGQDGFVEPASIDPIEKTRACPLNADDHCGKSDYCNVTSTTGGAQVLWDDLNPHVASAAKSMSWNVKLPDIECDNCTLQVIQVMEDTVHGAYCPQGSCPNSAASLEDIYHRCIDIKLKKGATNSPGATTDPVTNMGMECAVSAPAAGTGGGAGTPSAGAGGAAGTAAAGGGSAVTGSSGKAAIGGAGAPATSSAGSIASAGTAGGAGSAATTVPVSPSGAGATGTTSGTQMVAGTLGGAAAVAGNHAGSPQPPAAGTTKSSGCAVRDAGGRGSNALLAAWLLGLVGIAMRRRGVVG